MAAVTYEARQCTPGLFHLVSLFDSAALTILAASMHKTEIKSGQAGSRFVFKIPYAGLVRDDQIWSKAEKQANRPGGVFKY